MGSLIINKVSYFGDEYYFESPELNNGINLIIGDNGSGKSTFSYLIEYGLGGTIKYFRESSREQYKEIVKDTNNYVILNLTISGEKYIIKRFVKSNPGIIFVQEKNEFKTYPVSRNNKTTSKTFSDWILEKLNINIFKLYLGTTSYFINFNDIFRLLNYDQDTPSRKIYKAPSTENYVTDSIAIRKAIFEVLLGISSNKYTNALNELRQKKEEKAQATYLLNNILENNDRNINLNDFDKEKEELEKLSKQVCTLIAEREKYQKNNSHINTKFKISQINELQSDLTAIEIKLSQKETLKNEYTAEYNNIRLIALNIEKEISELIKIIHTNDTLNLFSLENCPFCGKPNTHGHDKCICGESITDTGYKKFVYQSSEYKNILDYRRKRLETIYEVMKTEKNELKTIDSEIERMKEKSIKLKNDLHDIISHIHFSGNSQIIDSFNNKILETKEKILYTTERVKYLEEISRLTQNLNLKKESYDEKYHIYNDAKRTFEKDIQTVVESFEKMYSSLLKLSSCKVIDAHIDEDYLPVIDSGIYKEKSSIVPIRLMYYYTIFALGLQQISSNHPHFLIIDTPEEAGIDEDNLKVNLELLSTALDMVKITPEQSYQVILTTGMNKYPKSWEKFIKLKLNKKNNQFILKKKENK